MRLNNQTGSINILLIPLIVLFLFFCGAAGFGVWAYQGRQDYKLNVDKKIGDAVIIANQKLSTQKDKDFAEKEKLPLRTYIGPSAYGSLSIQYPKTWSAYIADNTDTDPFIEGYFYPGTVPNITKEKASFALRVVMVQESYSAVLADFQSQLEQGKVSISPYKLAKVPNIVGSRVNGEVEEGMNGSMILLPLRDKTLKIWTNSTQFLPDFETNILPNFSFSP